MGGAGGGCRPPSFFLTSIFDELEKIVLKWKIVQNYKTSWNPYKSIDTYNIVIDLDTRDDILLLYSMMISPYLVPLVTTI